MGKKLKRVLQFQLFIHSDILSLSNFYFYFFLLLTGVVKKLEKKRDTGRNKKWKEKNNKN